jgi:hypothetical protein
MRDRGQRPLYGNTAPATRASQFGHKPSFPTRSKILSRTTYEWQVSGEKTEPLFGSTRPAAVARARQLQGKPNIIAAVLEQALIEEILARLNCGSVRRSRHGLSAAPFSKRGARRRAW